LGRRRHAAGRSEAAADRSAEDRAAEEEESAEMSDDLFVEATGETVGEAKWAALRELERLRPGLDKSAVKFEVVSEGERGLLGVGFAPARVVATIGGVLAVPPPVDESDLAADVRGLVEL